MNGFHRRGRLFLSPVVRMLAAAGVPPAALTVGGMVICLIASWLVWRGLYLEAGLVMALGSVLDAMDGGVARLTGKVSKAGAALDSILDRVSESALFIGILAGRAGSEHVTLLYAAPTALAGSFMVSYVRARAEGLGMKCEAGFFTRTERLIVLIVGLFAAGFWGSKALVAACALIAGGAWFTALQRLVKVLRSGSGLPL